MIVEGRDACRGKASWYCEVEVINESSLLEAFALFVLVCGPWGWNDCVSSICSLHVSTSRSLRLNSVCREDGGSCFSSGS